MVLSDALNKIAINMHVQARLINLASTLGSSLWKFWIKVSTSTGHQPD